ncbi:hypothetical protein GY45DRAFT_1277940 [Cubamyces sp. BRFM 1775]|nr:hypothetical protein GY45DRAFT_1277940 [Cubamyces sp. BRFM 1775]
MQWTNGSSLKCKVGFVRSSDSYSSSPSPSKFVSPYPPTHWCDVPKERNVIHNPLCRPLPRVNFPPPPPERMPVVGTPEWQAWKQRQNGMRAVTAWTRDAPPPPPSANTLHDTAASSTGSDSTLPVLHSGSSDDGGGIRTVPVAAWRNATSPTSPPGLPLGLMRGDSSSGTSQQSVGSEGGWGGPPSVRSVSPHAAQSSSGTSSGDDAPPATPSVANVGHDPMVAGGPAQGPFAALSIDDLDDEEYYGAGEALQQGGDARSSASAGSDVMYYPRADSVFVHKPEGSPATPGEDKADRDEEEDEEEDNPIDSTGEKKLVCPEHNVVCRKGICSVMAKLLRAEKFEKRRQELERERAEREAKRAKAAKKKKKDNFPLATSSPSRFESSGSGGGLPVHLRRPGAAAPPPPPHLRAGAPPLSPSAGPGTTRPMPPHLRSRPANPSPDPDAGGRWTPTPSRRGEDDARSGTGGWGDNISEGPWGVSDPKPPKSKSRGTPAPAPSWGKVPSISASSVRRNNDSWSVSAGDADEHDDGGGIASPWTSAKTAGKAPAKRDYGAWGRAPSISASSVRRNNDSWSVSARSVAGAPDGDAGSVVGSDDGNWGRPPSEVGDGRQRSWAEQMDEEDELEYAAAASDNDTRSVAASATSGWGNVSAGPW